MGPLEQIDCWANLRRVIFLCGVGCLAMTPASGQMDKDPAQALHRSLNAMLDRRSDAGGWVMAWSEDGSIYWGEHRQRDRTFVTVQPAATPEIGRVFLRAARVLGDQHYLEAALQARDALLSIQTERGGFPLEDTPANPGGLYSTFDDDTTTGAVRFLLDCWKETGNPEDLENVKRVGEFILGSQYESGGWPQRVPFEPTSFRRCITFNDFNMSNIVSTCLLLYRELDDVRYYDAALRAGDCIIRIQGGPGERIWAQQYDPDSLEPAWARRFEPPGYASSESVAVCDTLIELYLRTDEERFLEPLPDAFDWYDTHRGPDGLWSRLTEPGTGRPVYGRPDKAVPLYEVEHAAKSYGWRGDWYPYQAKKAYDRIREVGSKEYVAERDRSDVAPSRELAADIITAMSAGGEWVEPPDTRMKDALLKMGVPEEKWGKVHSRLFCENANTLLDFLAKAE
jgi:hypothetical protein